MRFRILKLPYFLATHQSYAAMFTACLALTSGSLFAQTSWVGTWATSPELINSSQSQYLPPAPGLPDNSLRQVLQVSIGGDTLRMRFTNEYTSNTVTLNAATIAVSSGAGAVQTSTLSPFRFNGNASVTLPANAYVYSDPLPFTLTPRMTVQVTLYFGSAANVTGHRGSRATARILTGNRVNDANFNGSTNVVASYVISSLEVRAPVTAGAVAILGNSITDGFGTTTDGFNRWTDAFAANLQAHARTSRVGVLNSGIGAGCMMSGCGVSTPGINRYRRDLFDHGGVKWILIMLGVNDVGAVGSAGAATTVSNNLIGAYTQIADSARARGIRAYGATIMPFNGNGYYNTNSEACRRTVNAWIRSTNRFDAVIDFDRMMRDPGDTTRLIASYSNDWLHPSIAGYAFMGRSVDTNLFIQSGTGVAGPQNQLGYSMGDFHSYGFDGKAMIAFKIPRETFVSLKIHSALGMEIAELAGKKFPPGEHVVGFESGKLQKGIYFYSMKADRFSSTRKLILRAP